MNDRKRRIADKTFTREELGLPRTGFVFCCFNTNYKILPTTFAGWMSILKAVPGSVLFLYSRYEVTKTNLRAQAARHGVDPQRLVFGERMELPEYLARYRTADLFLDTMPYNAGTTASDALWAGLPVLTLSGEAVRQQDRRKSAYRHRYSGAHHFHTAGIRAARDRARLAPAAASGDKDQDSG